jgi:hypothetical protein
MARGAIEPRRSALLEQLLARAEGCLTSDWRADAFRVIAPHSTSMPAVAAAALCAEGGSPGAAWVCIATPVRYLAEMTSVRLSQDGILSLRPADAEALALDFNRLWMGSGIRMTAGKSAHLYCIFDRTLNVTTRDPQDVLDRHIEEFLPTGPDAPRLRQLMSEVEMWLFERMPPLSGLWLWGGGAPIAALPAVQGWVAGDDVFFNALRKSDRSDRPDSGVIVSSQVPGGDGWPDIESRWLKPAVAQLRCGLLTQLEVSAGDRRFILSTRGTRRFWRRSKPWWESFA